MPEISDKFSELHCFKDLSNLQVMNIVPWLPLMNLDNKNKNDEIVTACKRFLDDREISKNTFITNDIHKVEIEKAVNLKTNDIKSKLDESNNENSQLKSVIDELKTSRDKLENKFNYQKENNNELIKEVSENLQKDFEIEKLQMEAKYKDSLNKTESELHKYKIQLEGYKDFISKNTDIKSHIDKGFEQQENNITKELKYQEKKYHIPTSKQSTDMHNLHHSKSTSDRGNVGEMDVNTVIEEPLGYQQHGTHNKVSRKMDGSIYDRNNPYIKILCEAKKYGKETYLGQTQIDKFRRDLKENDNISGIFIAWQKNIQYENIKNGTMILRDNKAELYLCGDECYPGSPFMKNYIKLFYNYTIKLYELKNELRKKFNDNHLIKVFNDSFTKLSSIMTQKEKVKENLKKNIDGLDKTLSNLRNTFKHMNNSDDDIIYLIDECLQKDFETSKTDNITIQKSDGISETITDSNDDTNDTNDTNDNIVVMLQKLDTNNSHDSNDNIDVILQELDSNDSDDTDNTDNTDDSNDSDHSDDDDNNNDDDDDHDGDDDIDIKTIILENFEKSEKINNKAQLRETTSALIKLLIEKYPCNNNIKTLRSGFKDDKEKISDILIELGYEESCLFGKNSKDKKIEKRNKSWNIKIK